MKRAESAHSDAGFSLIEAMTSLFILALMAGAVVLMMPSPDQASREFARQFAGRVALASEESIIVNRTHALVVSEDGYGFARLEDNGWRMITHGSPLAFRALPDEIALRVEDTLLEADEGRVARFDALGSATPARVLIDGAGARWRVEIDGQGRAHVEPVE